MDFGAAISTHPIPAIATGEAIGALLESVGIKPDLVLLFATLHHTGALADIAGAVLATLAPRWLVGCTAPTVFANNTDSGRGSGLVLWAGRLPDWHRQDLRAEWHATWDPERPAHVALVDGFNDALQTLADHASGGIPFAGATVSGGTVPGANRLILNDRIESSGALHLWIPGKLRSVQSHGGRALGDRHTVTASENRILRSLAFTEPHALLQAAMRDIEHHEHDKRAEFLVGVVSNDHGLALDAPSRTTRILGMDRTTGALALADHIDVGAVVQFFVRTPTSAQQELTDRLVDAVAPAPVGGGLAFTDHRRNESYFGQPHRDCTTLSEVSGAPIAGITSRLPLGRRANGTITPMQASALFLAR